jgi:hypothetical protein
MICLQLIFFGFQKKLLSGSFQKYQQLMRLRSLLSASPTFSVVGHKTIVALEPFVGPVDDMIIDIVFDHSRLKIIKDDHDRTP